MKLKGSVDDGDGLSGPVIGGSQFARPKLTASKPVVRHGGGFAAAVSSSVAAPSVAARSTLGFDEVRFVPRMTVRVRSKLRCHA